VVVAAAQHTTAIATPPGTTCRMSREDKLENMASYLLVETILWVTLIILKIILQTACHSHAELLSGTRFA
jgi:hypothetical protein